jgi:hypothetical protein
MKSKLINFDQFPEQPTIYRQEIFSSGQSLGWNFTLEFKKSGIISSGTDVDSDTALRKAYSESLERFFIFDRSICPSRWKLDIINSTDCFAAGFDPENVLKRSEYEAVERYVRLNIAEGAFSLYNLEEGSGVSIANTYANIFDDYATYASEVTYSTINNYPVDVFFVCVVGKIDGAAYFGYCINHSLELAVQHAYVEAYRNKLAVDLCLADKYSDFLGKNYILKLANLDQQSVFEHQLKASLKGNKKRNILPKVIWQDMDSYLSGYISRTFLYEFQGKMSAKNE